MSSSQPKQTKPQEKRRKTFADIVTHPSPPKPGVIKDKLEFRNVGGAG